MIGPDEKQGSAKGLGGDAEDAAGKDAEQGFSFQVEDESTQAVIKMVGAMMTARGGLIEVTDNIRDICALVEDGTFLVSKSHLYNPHVLSLQARARQQGYRVNHPTPVDLGTIKKAYDAANRTMVTATQSVSSATKMQRETAQIVTKAAKLRASDIHVIVNPDTAVVRLRIDGMLVDFAEMQPGHALDLCQTAFSMTDTSDNGYMVHEFQGARIANSEEVGFDPSVQSVRVQWNPLAFNGRYMIMRLLYRSENVRQIADLDALGYSKSQLAALKYMRAQPLGVNMISGPTGSGKSTTLQRALLNLLYERNAEINILTVEDPCEYVIPGVQQMPVTGANKPEERAVKFQLAIIAALRSDPDALMLGECRDPESAKLLFQGAMTGHQMWTSIHANSAIGIIDRLRDMMGESETYKITDPTIVTGLIAQRLVRLLCPNCRITMKQSLIEGGFDVDRAKRTVTILGNLGMSGHTIYCRGPGCKSCKRGYIGRTVITEVILPDEEFMQMMRENRKHEAREYWLTTLNGFTMLTHGVAKMLLGLCGPQEIEESAGVLTPDSSILRALDLIQD